MIIIVIIVRLILLSLYYRYQIIALKCCRNVIHCILSPYDDSYITRRELRDQRKKR